MTLFFRLLLGITVALASATIPTIATGATGSNRSASELQLPNDPDEPPGTVTPPNDRIDAIDQQPVDTVPQHAGTLNGRIGSTDSAFAAIHGAPIEEVASEIDPMIIGRAYPPPATALDLFVIYVSNQAAILVVTAMQPWTGVEAASVIRDYLPQDVTSVPDGEVLADGSLLISTFSADLASGVAHEMMRQSGFPGVPGDLYLLLVTDGNERAIEIEIGIGNGDDVRNDINSEVRSQES